MQLGKLSDSCLDVLRNLSLLSAYESLVLEYEGTRILNNGVCQMMYGVITLSESKAKEAELHLLSMAETGTGFSV